MWIRYAHTEDAENFRVSLTPEAVYIEQVYLSGDYSDLAIGTT